ncbi:MAG: addiction module toxin, HicA family [Phycisphaera sp.]|nr:addiction module toxin, HicA family [Phycisphaera sp.]
MPGKLRRLSAREIEAIFARFGFIRVAGGKGSHLKLRRVLLNGTRQTLIMPDHKELDRGTLASIYRKALAYLPDNDLRPHFYTD